MSGNNTEGSSATPTQEKRIDKDLFENKPVPQAVRSFVIPALISSTITLIYGLVDAYFVGLMGNPLMMAGLTVAFPFTQYLQGFANLWGVGTNTVMSVALGRGDTERVSRSSLYGFWGGVVFMGILSVIVYFARVPLLMFAGGSPETIGYASDFMFWSFVIGGIPCVMSVIMANQLRAEGHAKAASFGLAAGGVLNMFFDPLFMFALNMNVAGAAIADMAASLCSFAYFLWYWRRIRHTSFISIKPYAHNIRWENLADIFLCGLPSCWLSILGATGNVVQNSLYAKYNDAAVASWGVVNRVSFVAINCTFGIAQGILPLVGYNYGARNTQRVRAVIRHAVKLLMAIAITLVVLCELFPRQILSLFLQDELALTEGAMIMRIYILNTPFMATILFTSTMFQAVKKPKYSLAMLTIRQLVFNIPLAILWEHLFGLPGVPAGQPSCDFIIFFLALWIYHRVFVTQMREMGAIDEA